MSWREMLDLLRARMLSIQVWACILLSAATLSSCSNKKNTAATRNYQAFITRYNVYFNGDQHFKQTLKEMEGKYEDDYTSRVLMHPAEAKANPKAPQPSGNFKRSIEKAQKAIQLHSIKKRPARKGATSAKQKEWLKREEYNPFMHNAWMLMGRSQYYNGDFLGAASTFYYIYKHFSWLPNTVMEARLWQARSYCALDWLYEAEDILRLIKPEELTDNTQRDLYYFSYADYYVRSKEDAKAIPMLEQAVKYALGSQKSRLNFLLGQLYASVGEKDKAYQAFKKSGSSASTPYRTKLNARIRQSEVFTGSDIKKEVNALKRMTRYERNKDYQDQIYYAIGNLYLSRGDTVQAIDNYIKAAQKSTRNGVEKAISQTRLGGLYFDQGDYSKAQPCYAEGIPQLPEDYPDYKALKLRSDVLDELAVYSDNVQLNDSLLDLAKLTKEERAKIFDRYIEEVKKKEREAEEQAKIEEAMMNQDANGMGTAQAPNQYNLNNDKSWYFYNTQTRNSGKTEFQRRWGSRKLEDNWRRRNKAQYSSFDDTETTEEGGEKADGKTEETEEEKEARERENDPHYPEYYEKQVPITDEAKQTCNEVIIEGLYNMGIILKDKLEDFNAAQQQWDELLKRFPDNIYRLDAYNNMYLMNMRRHDELQANHYKQLILDEFPDSKYAAAMRDPNYLENLRNMESRQNELYDQAYESYLNNDNRRVHEIYQQMEDTYPLSKIMPKFMFLHALSYVTEKKPDEFSQTLKDLVERYPDSDVAPLSSTWVKGINQGRKLNSGQGVNMRGMLWDIRLTNDTTMTDAERQALEFLHEPEEPQLLVLLFSTDSISPNQLLFEVARHNFSTFVVRDFDLETMNFGQLGLLIVKGFANEKELLHYRELLKRDGEFSMPSQVRPVMISQGNFDKLLKGAGSFDDYFKFIGEDTYKTVARNNGVSEELPAENPEPAEDTPSEGTPSADIPTEETPAEEIEDLPIPMPEAPEIKEPERSETPESAQPEVKEPEKPLHKEPEKPQPKEPEKPQPKEPEKPQPKEPETPKAAEPTLPDYLQGGEGDDPLLD